MDRVQILVIGREQNQVELLKRLIEKQENWLADTAITDEGAIDAFIKAPYDIVLFSSKIEASSEEKLKSVFSFQNDKIIFIQHYGGGSGLLLSEINEAWNKQKVKISFNYMDTNLN